jgi:hypothetical protein
MMIITDLGIVLFEPGYSQNNMMDNRSDIKIDFFFVVYNMERKGRIMIDITALRGVIIGKN